MSLFTERDVKGKFNQACMMPGREALLKYLIASTPSWGDMKRKARRQAEAKPVRAMTRRGLVRTLRLPVIQAAIDPATGLRLWKSFIEWYRFHGPDGTLAPGNGYRTQARRLAESTARAQAARRARETAKEAQRQAATAAGEHLRAAKAAAKAAAEGNEAAAAKAEAKRRTLVKARAVLALVRQQRREAAAVAEAKLSRRTSVTLAMSRRADGRWQKKIDGKLVYLGNRQTTHADARAMLVRMVGDRIVTEASK